MMSVRVVALSSDLNRPSATLASYGTDNLADKVQIFVCKIGGWLLDGQEGQLRMLMLTTTGEDRYIRSLTV
jgi:hypothetical protein